MAGMFYSSLFLIIKRLIQHLKSETCNIKQIQLIKLTRDSIFLETAFTDMALGVYKMQIKL